MNVFLHELRVSLVSALCWALSLAAVGLGVILIAPVFISDAQALVDMMKSSEWFFRALGFTTDAINSFNGFYSIMMLYVVLCGAVQALTFGIQVIAKEGARKTSDFLFSRPLPRQSILLSKYLAMAVLTAMISLAYAAVTWPAARSQVADFDQRVFLLCGGSLLLTSLLCLSIGFCIGCFARKIKSPNGVAIGIGALFFALMMVENLSQARSIAFLTPLAYLNPRQIALRRGYDMRYFWALMVLTAVFALAGVIRYKTKDIHAA